MDLKVETRGYYFWAGVRAELPILIGVFPFGIIYGSLALNAGLSELSAQAMSVIVFAGSAQFVTTKLINSATPAIVIILTIAVVNLRHLLYSASIAPYLADVSLRFKVLLSYLLTDEAYAPSVIFFTKYGKKVYGHWFLLGAGLMLWGTWQISTAIGVFLGTTIPKNWSLDFALPLTFIAMVVPSLNNYPALCSALCAGVVSLIAYPLPYKLGIIISTFVGICVGNILEKPTKSTIY